MDLYDDLGALVTGTSTRSTFVVKENSVDKVEFSINSDVDLSSVGVGTDNFKTVVENLSDVSCIETHSLFINRSRGNGTYVCPSATAIEDVVVGCAGFENFTHAECAGGTVTKEIDGDTVLCTIDGNNYKVSGLTGTGIGGDISGLQDGVEICDNLVDDDGDTLIDCDDTLDCCTDPACLLHPSCAGAVPEFSTVGLILAILVIGVGVLIISRKK